MAKDFPRAAVDIEKSLTVQTDGQQVEEWLELANGCMYIYLLTLAIWILTRKLMLLGPRHLLLCKVSIVPWSY